MPGKTDLINSIADKTKLSKSDVGRVIDETLNEVRVLLDSGESVTLRGFGTFKVTERAARKGRNPRTGEPIDIAASKHVSFKMSK
ncbi:MAG: HU family DNA-binding protein [Chloroflexia bacterium]